MDTPNSIEMTTVPAASSGPYQLEGTIQRTYKTGCENSGAKAENSKVEILLPLRPIKRIVWVF
jgi:hypothetical protein